ncbi:MAG: acetyl-CoA carboxylase biotin carboxyl carrier protein [Phycisphaerae bacterium]|nr:acetyl-CoA carboxylase biotin carboxyl carrier protein [Phycisphaerae bacterium]
MDIEDIKQLVQLMVDNDLSELDVSDGERRISLKRGPSGLPVVAGGAMPAVVAPLAAAPAAGVPPAEQLLEIKSPMVGTFYAAPSPDSEPYVSVGAAVSDDTVVCVVEAMKVMNEIKAECAGTLVEVCVNNTQPVEYGQVLFRVRPS